ncbi:MAG: hypothetical protein RLZ33_591 [Bacteroidota bacterium]
MYDAVRQTFDKHQAVWSENQALVLGVEQFNALFEDLNTASVKQANIVAGIVSERDAFISELVKKAMILRDGLVVYAYETKRYDIAEKLKFTAVKLAKMTRLELSIRMATIYELVTENEAEVAAYGVSSDKILAFMDLYEEFQDQLVAVRMGIVERKFLTARIEKLKKEINDLFKNKLDILARLISVEQPEFFADYKSARIVIEKKNAAKQPPESDIDIGAAS